ncbi:hypothetical protein IJT10_05860 [bacterium]|nr:hypothetical protein [bacterium]
MSGIDDRVSLEIALNKLRIYNSQMLYIPLEDSALTEMQNTMVDYFKAEENSEKANALEKLVGVAAVKAVYDNPDVPDEYKGRVARRTGRELIEVAKLAKVSYMYNEGMFGKGEEAEEERDRRLEENVVMKKYGLVDNLFKSAENLAKKVATKGLISYVTEDLIENEQTAKFVKSAAIFAVSIIPEDIKTGFKKKAREVSECAANVVKRVAERVSNTRLGKKVTSFVETHVKPLIDRGVKVVESAVKTAKAKAKSLWTKVKSWFA